MEYNSHGDLMSILEKLKTIIEVIKNIIKSDGKVETKLLEALKYYEYAFENQDMRRGNLEGFPMGKFLGEISEGIATFGDFSFPIGSFEQHGNTITVKERVEIHYDEKNKTAKMYMNGKQICSNPEVEKEIARQIEQNGRPSTIKVNNKGEVVRSAAEDYRASLYNAEARQKTEEVGRTFEQKQKEKQEQVKETQQTRNADEELAFG